MTVDTIRGVFGPLPLPICTFAHTLKQILVLIAIQITLIMTFFKFSFIFVFKTIPIMEDKFLSLFIFISVNLSSCFIMISRLYIIQRPLLPQVSTFVINSMFFFMAERCCEKKLNLKHLPLCFIYAQWP